MDSHISDGSGALALEPLCQGAAQELLMRSYTIRTVNRYKRVWEQLADFARAQGLPAEYTRGSWPYASSRRTAFATGRCSSLANSGGGTWSSASRCSTTSRVPAPSAAL